MTATDLLQAGQQAISTGDYAKAVELLEACCQNASSRSPEFLKARMALVKAYYQCQNVESAIALCQELTQYPNAKVQAWAKQALDNLPTPVSNEHDSSASQELLPPDEAQEILQQGNKALKLRRYDEAVQLLEKFYQQTDSSYQDHYQAQMLLVKAYQNNQQLESAIDLCQKLTTVHHEVTQIWARNYLITLAPEIAQAALGLPQDRESTDVEQESTHTRLPKRTLEEFKDFCRQNLLEHLRELEKTRKQILTPLAIVSVAFIFALVFIIKSVPAALDDRISATTERCETSLISMNESDQSRPFSSEVRVSNSEQSLGKKPPKRCRSFLIPRWTGDGLKRLSLFLSGIVISAYLWVAFYTSSTETYGRGFPRTVIEKIVSFLDPQQNLTYSRSGNDQAVLFAFRQTRLFAGIGNSTYVNQHLIRLELNH
jgi:outer membrane protein assembly factor BamD (BamD/ComL family)